MSAEKKKKKPAPRRNPFAGRPQSGAGFHSEDKYGKKDRREAREELETELEEEAGEGTGGREKP